jgi:hypothetical protein
MAKTIFKNEMAAHSLRHRAICDDDTFKGPWRTNIEEAYADARRHIQQGNELHYIRIVTEQTLSMKFEE